MPPAAPTIEHALSDARDDLGPAPDILGIGCAVLDTVAAVDDFPKPDEKTRIFDLQEQGGGVAATATVAARRLGRRAAVIAKIGDDEPGRKLVEGLRAEEVDVSQMVVGPGETSMTAFCFAQRRTGRRVIYYHRSGLRPLKIEQIPRPWLQRARVVMIDGSEVTAGGQAAEIARGAGARTVVDAGSAREGFREALPHIDYLVASWPFARDYTQADTPEAALEALRWTGWHRAVIITLGEEGYLAAEGGRTPWRGEAFRVRAADTTGAGDTFHGAFCVGLIEENWPLEQVCVFSAACAALKCSRLGGRAGIPRREELLAFLKENARRYRWPAE